MEMKPYINLMKDTIIYDAMRKEEMVETDMLGDCIHPHHKDGREKP